MVALLAKYIVVAAAVAAFGACLASSFHFDDYAILSDPVLTSPSGWWQVWQPLQTRPLTYFTFWLNYQLGGANPAGYHLVNLLLHLGAVLMLVRVLRRCLPDTAVLAAASLFALHPIQAEPVLYVFARATLLATLLCLASFDAWLREKRWLAAGWFALALAAKEECVAFPLVLLLMHVMERRNVRERWPIAGMLALSLASGLRVFAALHAHPDAPAGAQAGVSVLDYLSAQGPVILRYLRLLVIPAGFTVDPDIAIPSAAVALAAWVVLAAAIIALAFRLRGSPYAFWILAGFILLAPSSSIFPAQDLAADRRMYLPVVAFSAALGLLAARLDRRVVAGFAAILALLSFERSMVWMSEESLWEEAVRRAPAKIRPKIQLARAVAPPRAIELLNEAKRLAPENANVATELGRALLAAGRPAEALGEFGRALALEPASARAINNRGVALMALGQNDAARQDFERALRVDPCQPDARANLQQMGVTPPLGPGCRGVVAHAQ
jgi:tetratricopeptide (TPR) repeat protein